MRRALALSLALCAQLALAGMPRLGGEAAQPELQDGDGLRERRGVFHFSLGPELFVGTAQTFRGFDVAEQALSARVGLLLGVSLGGRLTPAVSLLGEFSAAAAPDVTNTQALMWHAELMAVLDVCLSALIFPVDRAPPVLFGVDFGLGVGGGGSGQAVLALPVVRPGLYARYVTSPGFSIGVSVRGLIPFWSRSPWAPISQTVGDPGSLGFALQLERAF